MDKILERIKNVKNLKQLDSIIEEIEDFKYDLWFHTGDDVDVDDIEKTLCDIRFQLTKDKDFNSVLLLPNSKDGLPLMKNNNGSPIMKYKDFIYLWKIWYKKQYNTNSLLIEEQQLFNYLISKGIENPFEICKLPYPKEIIIQISQLFPQCNEVLSFHFVCCWLLEKIRLFKEGRSHVF